MSAAESPARLSQMLQWPRVDRTPTHPEILIKKFIFSMIGKLHQVFIPFSKKKKIGIPNNEIFMILTEQSTSPRDVSSLCCESDGCF